MDNTDDIKDKILKLHKEWKALGDSLDDIKYADIYESGVQEMLVKYCEARGYQVDGYPFEKRKLALTDNNYDEDYFSYERDAKYIDVLAVTYDDVFDLKYFYTATFWPEDTPSRDQFRAELLEFIRINIYDIDF